MKKSSSTKSKPLIFFIACIMIFATGFAFFSASNSSYSAYAADINSKNGTMLGGNGLQFGKNEFILGANEGGGNKTGSGNYYNSRDFYVENTSAFTYSPTDITVQGGTINSKLKLDTSKTNGGVYWAIQDDKMVVAFKFNAKIQNSSNYPISLNAEIKWSNNSDSVTYPINNLASGASVTLQDIAIENIVTIDKNNNANNFFTVKISSNDSNAEYTMSAAYINMEVSMPNMSIGQNAIYSVSGSNRDTQSYDSTKENYANSIKSLYIKAGDLITMQTTVHHGGTADLYIFPDYYQAVFGLTGGTGVVWEAYSKTEGGVIRPESRLEIISDALVNSGGKQHYEVVFRAEEGIANLNNVFIKPKIFTSYSASAKATDAGAQLTTEIDIKVDSSAPSQPVIDETSPLGAAIKGRQYYTSSSSMKEGTDFGLNSNKDESKSLEYLYAFVLPNTVSTVDFSDNDGTKRYFSPSNIGASYEGAKRQNLISWENDSNGVLNKRRQGTLDFPTEGGEFTVVFVMVDAAGNQSAVKVYSSYNNPQNSILVDSRMHDVNIGYSRGTSEISTGSMNIMASTYVITGTGTHDVNGNLISSDGKIISTEDFIATRGAAYRITNGRAKARRDAYVTIVIAMSREQAKQYQLVSYTNNSSIVSGTIIFQTPTDPKKPITATLKAFKLTGEFIPSGDIGTAKNKINFTFREVLNLSIDYLTTSTADMDFTGSVINIRDRVKAQNSAGNDVNNVQYEIKYYNIIEYVATLNTNKIGGTIDFGDGIKYTNDTNNLSAPKGTILINGKRYVTIATKQNPNNAEGREVWTVTAYCLDTPHTDENGQLTGFVDAGIYWYTATILETNPEYYGTNGGYLNIRQISPNVSNVKVNPITYGASTADGKTGLDLLEFESTDENGNTIPPSLLFNLFGNNYYSSYYGVLGIYVVTSPAQGSDEYINPSVNPKLSITVEFRPIDITNGGTIDDDYIRTYFAILKDYYQQVGDSFELKSGGMHAINYKLQSITVDVQIKHQEVKDVAISNETQYIYDGTSKSAVLTSATPGLPFIIEYKQKGAADTAYTTQSPFNAGEYVVRYSIDSTQSNYYSVQKEENFIIEKRSLNIELQESTQLQTPIYFDEIEFTKQVLFAFGLMATPKVLASYFQSPNTIDVSVGYLFQHKKVLDYDDSPILGTDYGDPYDTIVPHALSAGTYIFKMIINNLNNKGEIYILLRIQQVILNSGDDNFKVSFPSLRSDYFIYNLDNKIFALGSDSSVGNIEYGQSITAMQKGLQNNLINVTSSNIATYTYRGDANSTVITGRYYLEEEAAIYKRLGITPIYNANGEPILPVSYYYDSDGTRKINAYSIQLYWEAGTVVDGEFVVNHNFYRATNYIDFYVARAAMDFSSVTLSDLIFGQELGNASFNGQPTINGRPIFINGNKVTLENIDGKLLNGLTFDGIKLDGKNFAGKKVLVVKDNGEIVAYLEYENAATYKYTKGHFDVVSRFATREGFADSYRSINEVKIGIDIYPSAATITFNNLQDGAVLHEFGAAYRAPVVTTSPENGINVKYSFTNQNGDPIIISNTTPVGNYFVTATIDDENYGGSATTKFNIVKSDLRVTFPPSAAPASYGVKLGDIRLTTGTCTSLAGLTVNGSFEFVDKEIIPEVGTFSYKTKFIPNDPTAYDSYNEFYYDYLLEVSKRTVTIKYDNLRVDFDTTPKRPTATALDPNGNPLKVVITYTDWAPQAGAPADPIMAGKYAVTMQVDSPHYTARVNAVLTINKAKVDINTEDQTLFYDGEDKFITPSSSIENLEYSVKYKNFFGSETLHPKNVGKYFATVTIDHANYAGSAMVVMYIAPSSFVMNNLEQTFNVLGNIGVTASFYPRGINHSIAYRLQGSSASFTTDTPAVAGKYNIMITVEHEGYIKEITTYIDNSDIVLNIAKAEAIVTAPSSYERNYIAQAHNDLKYTVEPSVSTLIWFKEKGASDDTFTQASPINAGKYEIKIEVNDKNYFGSARSELIINPATLVITDVPRITSTNRFSHSLSEVTFSGTGIVRFNATGANMADQGVWKIDEDDTAFKLLAVGQHNVKLLFIPNDARNFLPTNITSVGGITATINITIEKEDIGKYIVFNETDLIQQFNNKQISVRAGLSKEATIIPNYNNIIIRVTYSGNTIQPKDVGSYSISAEIEDANYRGVAKAVTLTILKADLSIIAPTFSNLALGSKAGDAIKIKDGQAYIAIPGASEITSTVKGKFTFLNPNEVMNKANYRKVLMTFTPEDTNNYNYRNFEVQLFVLAGEVILDGVSATGITYGQPLSKSSLSATNSSQEGVFKWQNPNAIINVGDSATYIFTPSDDDNYNIVVGKITIEVQKAKLWADMDTLIAKVFVLANNPETLRDARISLNVYHDDHKGDPNWLVKTIKISLDDSNSGLDSDITNVGAITGISLNVVDDNYEVLTILGAVVYAYYPVDGTTLSFQIAHTKKIFDGKNVKVEDFGILLAGTAFQIENRMLSMVITKGGVVVENIFEAGEYEVVVSLKNKYLDANGVMQDLIYDGSATFTFTVEKEDISGSVSVINNEKTYGDYSTVIEAMFDGYDVDPSHVVFNYFSADGTKAYGVVAPQMAGNYKVRVTISALDNKFTASREFDYIIGKLKATISLKNSYTFTYGSIISIIPDISNNITSTNYKVTYSGSPIVPTNVGEYNVLFEIIHDNFVGTAETHLSIHHANLALEDHPALSPIKYGQTLSNSVISGGKVVFGTAAIPQKGTFSFVEPNKTDMYVGINTVSVQFTPTNQNFATLVFNEQITVLKASGSIIMLANTMIFTGKELKPQLETSPVSGLNLIITYRQNNSIVIPINAGEYQVEAMLNDATYEGSISITFTINRAVAVDVTSPVASEVEYGKTLENSSLEGGIAIYVPGGEPVNGTFRYTNVGRILGDVGTYENIDYQFVPKDTKNYEIYDGKVTVKVKKAVAKINANGIIFIYGSPIEAPLLTTDPKSLAIDNSEFLNSGILNTIQPVGTYSFTAFIDTKNFEGSLEYTISVTKKKLSIYYVDADGMTVNRYTTTYLAALRAKARINVESLVGSDKIDIEKIEKYIQYNYTNNDGTPHFNSHISPIAVGEYSVTIDLSHNDYYIDSTELNIPYIINRGKVEYLEFDSYSLSSQIYGSTVTTPYVITRPSNVKYKITFPGYDVMPTMAGTYTIRVLVTDENYEATEQTSIFRINPKDITIENIRVTNKPFDGTTNISIIGDLKGVMVGDEVNLNMTARARDGATAIGTHYVDILTWVLEGRHAKYYNLIAPLFDGMVKITSNAISDPNNGSYISNNNGFSQNITVSFDIVDDAQNKSNFFSSIFGQDAITQKISIKENGLEVQLDGRVKFYVRIPDKYKDKNNVTVVLLGDLAEGASDPQREGDFMTFYANKSGEIAIYSTDIPYATIAIVGIIVIVIIGLVLIFIFMPIKRRLKIKRSISNIHNKQIRYMQKEEERFANTNRGRRS